MEDTALSAAEDVLDALGRLNTAKREAEVAFAALPRLVRGFAESAVSAEIQRQTGQGLPAWEAVLGRVAAAREVLERPGPPSPSDRDTLRRVAGEVAARRADLARLLRCMEDAPPKVERLPRQVLSPERRTLALNNLRAQTGALRDALTAMFALERGLG